MTPKQLRRCCLERPGAAEEFPFGPQTAVFKVAGKISPSPVWRPGR